MTEFSPPDALITQNEQATTEMRINAWSHRDHVKPIMAHIFAAAARRAMELRAELIDDIEATGIEKFYYQYATLTDGRSIQLSNLLEFPLYSASLPVEQLGLPTDQQLSREYSVTLRVGGNQLAYGTDDSLDLCARNAGYRYSNSGAYEGERAYERVLRKDAVPETMKIIEKIETTLNLENSNQQSIVASMDNYYLKTQTWVPNLSHFGHPDVELNKITDISFGYSTSYDNSPGSIDHYGSMSNDKIACAKHLARLTQIAGQFLNISVDSSEEAASFKAIALAPEQPAL